MLKNVFVNVTNSNPNFSLNSGNMSDFKVGDLLAVRDSAKGSVIMEVATKNDTAKTGTFTNSYIGATASNLFATVIPVSQIDPTGDTVVKTALIEQITDALKRDQAQSAIWMQLLTTPSGNVTITLPDGTKFTGPAWQGIANEMLSKTATGAQSVASPVTFSEAITMNKTLTVKGDAVVNGTHSVTGLVSNVGNASTPTNLDVYGNSAFRKGVTFYDELLGQKGVVSDGVDNSDLPRMSCTRHYTSADTRAYTGGSFLARLHVGKGMGGGSELTTQFNMQLRHTPGQSEGGFIAYQGTDGVWTEAQWLRTGNIQNMRGSWVNTSDARMKTEIEEVADPIALMRGLKLYHYKKDGQVEIGVIAQEVQKQIPLAVSEGGEYTMNTTGEMISKCLGVSYGTLGAVAMAALDKALDRIEALEERLAKLEGK